MSVKFLSRIKHYLYSSYYRAWESLSPSAITDPRQVPIVINNFNRVTTLKKLIGTLEVRGYANIHIIDNRSTYPPLLEYYATCPYEVIMLDKNLGFKALWKSRELRRRFCGDYYAYTDSDVVPVDECPDDFMDYFMDILRRHPFARKVGFSLRIDDLPDHYAQKQEVVDWESRFSLRKTKDGLFRAPVDTTFALYRPRVRLSRSPNAVAYRTPFPYQLRHLPWYVDSQNPTEEERYYAAQCHQPTHWKAVETGQDIE